MDPKLIAPCGMNCSLCMAYLREKNRCNGCKEADKNRPKTRVFCRIRICKKRKGKYCFKCKEYPCKRLKQLDKRYRTKYGMSEIKNLEFINKNGIKQFIKNEEKRWVKRNKIFCIHKKEYFDIR